MFITMETKHLFSFSSFVNVVSLMPETLKDRGSKTLNLGSKTLNLWENFATKG